MNLTLTRSLPTETADLQEYLLENDCMSVSILNYGASVTGIYLPVAGQNRCSNILLSYESLQDYLDNPIYCGSTLGPNAGRISNGLLPIEDTIYELSQNDGVNQSHGGFHNLSRQFFTVKDTQIHSDCVELTLEAELSHLLDGYPGNRQFRVTYRLTAENRLLIFYHGTSDHTTYMNLTNHMYFNLSGDFNQSIFDHRLQINAGRYVESTISHLPRTIVEVRNTPFDFTAPITMRELTARFPDNVQNQIARGYNHAFLLEEQQNSKEPVLILSEKNTKRQMELYADTPSVVIYSSGFFDHSLKINQGCLSSPHCALAIEPQDVPDTPNFCPSAKRLLHPGEVYFRQLTYAFRF